MSHISKVFAGLMLLVLAACASQIKSDVARFHRLPPPQGESFRVVAADPQKQGSLEFATYAEYVAAEMVKQGYTRAQTPQRRDAGGEAGLRRIARPREDREPPRHHLRALLLQLALPGLLPLGLGCV
ncbi:hypothetical protein [Pedomonas mirosovicensis]|uniref:hypothetical protein n=1 Tax=Pedomonas mirosovicensis TaxID=2908641 RepID=UPI002167E12A|nr:hypothetical protein [Pedomonas mirosovicensis]MCH8684020.1 hypothetical protein [Pedomonas mirosovicensis]